MSCDCGPGATCGACAPVPAAEPPENPPRQSALDYRIGTYGAFLTRMLARLSAQPVPPDDNTADARRPLAALSTRRRDDPTVALVDAWACAADVMTFYQERIANEGFLRTATERRSVLEMARSIGYELKPGVSAHAHLAFELRDGVGAPASVLLAAGLQVQSVPGQGELPQLFETGEAITARPEWNAMRPRLSVPQEVDTTTTELYLAGTDAGLSPGDAVLLVDAERATRDVTSGRWGVGTVVEVTPEPELLRTRITLSAPFDAAAVSPPMAAPELHSFQLRAGIFGHNAPDPRTLSTVTTVQTGPPVETISSPWIDAIDAAPTPPVWRNYADIRVLDAALGRPGVTGLRAAPQIDLDGEQKALAPGSWLVLQQVGVADALYRVHLNDVAARTDYGLIGRAARLTLDTRRRLGDFDRRRVSALTVSSSLPLAERPLPDDDYVAGQTIALQGDPPPLPAGRAVIVAGLDDAGAPAAEVAWVQEMTRALLTLTAGLSHSYRRGSVSILGNVASATHGKTVAREVLGSGDGATPHPTFYLSKPPLTWLSADTPSGRQSALELRVNGVRWDEVGSLYGRGPDERVFVVRIEDDSAHRIQFGDGVGGARLPTGRDNVVASYRQGLGLEGMVDAGQLSLLKTRPLGVKGVQNPLPATGADAPEALADARRNAPRTVLTLDRLVSLQDYADFASGFSGVGKAQAVALWDGRARWIHLTVADALGRPIGATDPLYESLRGAIEAYRDPGSRYLLGSHVARSFRLQARVLRDDAWLWEDVEAAAKAAIADAFAFSERSFGQAVTAAEIVTLIHGVEGVIAVDLDALHDANEPPTFAPILGAAAARWDGGPQPAELLLLDEALDAVALTDWRIP